MSDMKTIRSWTIEFPIDIAYGFGMTEGIVYLNRYYYSFYRLDLNFHLNDLC